MLVFHDEKNHIFQKHIVLLLLTFYFPQQEPQETGEGQGQDR